MPDFISELSQSSDKKTLYLKSADGFERSTKFGVPGASHQFTGSVHISGNLYAQEYRVNIIDAQSGSTVFGNSSDDTHNFTGSVFMAGDISGSARGVFLESLTTAGGLNVTGSSHVGTVITHAHQFTGSIYISGTTMVSGNLIPGDDNVRNLGSAANRWANLYTGDLHLKNERGNWTIVEERDYLCVINNETGKKYKMMMQEIED